MKFLFRLGVLVTSLSILACSNTPTEPPESLTIEFTTRTTDSGAELFDYQILDIQRALRNANDKRARRDSGQTVSERKRAISRDKDIKQAARSYLAYELAESNYCPHGYFVLSEVLLPDSYKVRGECRSPHQGSAKQ